MHNYTNYVRQRKEAGRENLIRLVIYFTPPVNPFIVRSGNKPISWVSARPCEFSDYARLQNWKWMDGWVRVLRPFNSISVISRRWKGEHERLCAMKRRLGSGRISPPAGFEPATPWSEVGSANRSATRTLPKNWKWKISRNLSNRLFYPKQNILKFIFSKTEIKPQIFVFIRSGLKFLLLRAIFCIWNDVPITLLYNLYIFIVVQNNSQTDYFVKIREKRKEYSQSKAYFNN